MMLLAEPVSHLGSVLVCSLPVSFSPVHSALFDSWEVRSMTSPPPPFTVTSFHLPYLPFSSFALSPRLNLSHNKPLLHCAVWISLCFSLGPSLGSRIIWRVRVGQCLNRLLSHVHKHIRRPIFVNLETLPCRNVHRHTIAHQAHRYTQTLTACHRVKYVTLNDQSAPLTWYLINFLSQIYHRWALPPVRHAQWITPVPFKAVHNR